MAVEVFKGTIDVHVHDRGLTQWYKETPETASHAALAGGITTILAMPNTEPPVTDKNVLEMKLREANFVETYYGVYAAGVDGNQEEVREIADKVCALKLYMNNTTGNLLIDNPQELEGHFASWPGHRPICVHAEGEALGKALMLCQLHKKHLHVCHVSTEFDVLLIKSAKQQGFLVTSEVAPHHLFFTTEDTSYLGPLALVKPALATERDQEALWKAINEGVIDCFASDHAAHTLEEKYSENPPYGMPGLETMLPLMIQAVYEKRLTMERLKEMISVNPRKIFGINGINDSGSYANVEIGDSYEFDSSKRGLKTKCGWSPFEGHQMRGVVREVFVAGEKVFDNGEILPRFNNKSLILFQNGK